MFASLLEHNVRESDTVIRYGGDEFLIVATRATVEAAHLIVERLRLSGDALRRQADRERPWLDASFSVGAAIWKPGLDLDDVLHQADQNMYADKSGKGGTS
jgi:diguanylate cyclase (GGDEF)-like protein